jgi:hypothetical protein
MTIGVKLRDNIPITAGPGHYSPERSVSATKAGSRKVDFA